MRRTRILIIADSMAMPRDTIPYEDTWIFMIKDRFPDYDIIDRPESGSTTMRLVSEGGGGRLLLERYLPDAVIVQMGLAECAPRLFKKSGIEHFFISKVFSPSLRDKYIAFIKKRRVRNPHISYVPLEQFRKNIIDYCKRAQKINTTVIIIQIPQPTSVLLQKSPYVKQNIDSYNALLIESTAQFSNVICVCPFDESFDIDSVSIDEVHINRFGAKIIADALDPFLSEVCGTEGEVP